MYALAERLNFIVISVDYKLGKFFIVSYMVFYKNIQIKKSKN